jgi:RHS repeat-associated protein
VNVGYAYDELNRLAAVGDAQLGVTAYNYDDVGNLKSYAYPNFVLTEYQYDALNRLTNLASDRLGTPIANFSYRVAPAGNRTNAVEQLFSSVLNASAKTINRVYSYDSVYHLTGESISGTLGVGSANYSYDPVGNRLSRGIASLPLSAQSFTFDANDRLNTDTYDPNGNTLIGAGFGQSLADEYDFENRLITRHTSSCTVHITYDGDGNRVSKTLATATNSVTTYYVVDEVNPSGYAQVLEEHTATNSQPSALNCVYTYGHVLISQLSAINSQPSARFYGYDGHNNVRYLIGANANVTDTYDYDAFGNLLAQSGSTVNNYLFTGEQYDGDLGLYYLRARYQNTDTGRFWSIDLYRGADSDPGSLHKYAYANANPINSFDPSGFVSIAEMSAVSAIRNIGIQVDLDAGFAARDTLLYGPTVALRNVYTGAAISALIPFAPRILGRTLSKFTQMASEALPGGIAAFTGLQLRSQRLVQPYDMLLETMNVLGITGHEGGHLLPVGIFKKIPRSHGIAIPMEGNIYTQFSEHWKFHRSIEVRWDVIKMTRSRNPTVREFVNEILPDALQNAGTDPYTSLVLSEAAERQAIHFGYDLDDVLGNLTRNTKQ